MCFRQSITLPGKNSCLEFLNLQGSARKRLVGTNHAGMRRDGIFLAWDLMTTELSPQIQLSVHARNRKVLGRDIGGLLDCRYICSNDSGCEVRGLVLQDCPYSPILSLLSSRISSAKGALQFT